MRWDHPRACGEHACERGGFTPLLGSSPRLRGTQNGVHTARGFIGIIPALAGNTTAMSHSRTCPRDHPRACGEHPESFVPLLFFLGSSPRLRGTREIRVLADVVTGIIPALAGNTDSHSRGLSRKRDHPRACGEHNKAIVDLNQNGGSSPRLRGTQSGYP